jgi:phosphoglycerate dehydrogenase-like enzyme
MKPVFVLSEITLPAARVEQIRQLPNVRFETVPRGTLSSAKPLLAEANVIYTGGADFDPGESPHLRLVQTNTAAVNHVLDKPIMRTQVPLANVSGAYSVAVAECTFALLLGVTRLVPLSCRFQRDHQWPNDYLPFQGVDIFGKTLGIVGYGSIGRQVARLAQAFGMSVLACKRDPNQRRDPHYCRPGTGDVDGTIPKAWFGTDGMADMLSQSDVALVTLPLTPRTEKIVGRRELDALPRHAIFMSIGRGPVVDEDALIDVLRAGKIAGAGLDVFTQEPLPASSPLWDMPNVLILPHIASWTTNQTDSASLVLIENLRRLLNGQPFINVVHRELKY